jgi:hypothetical protein
MKGIRDTMYTDIDAYYAAKQTMERAHKERRMDDLADLAQQARKKSNGHRPATFWQELFARFSRSEEPAQTWSGRPQEQCC